MSEKESILKPHSLEEVPPEKIKPNPHNPRLFFPEESLSTLRESIRQLGVLMPLVVYRAVKDGQLYLLDGERRWRCAKDLRLPTVPVNVIPEPTTLQNMITMFNMHALRDPWELMPTALKLELIERLVKQTTGKKRVSVAYLHQITGMTGTTVRRCKMLLSYDVKYRDVMLAQGVDAVKTDFFIELYPVLTRIEHTFIDLYVEYGKNRIVDSFLDKYRKRIIKDVVALRRVQSLIRSTKKGVPKQVVKASLIELIDNPSTTIDSVYNPSVRVVYEIELIRNLVLQLRESLRNFDTDDPREAENLRYILTSLSETIKEKLASL